MSFNRAKAIQYDRERKFTIPGTKSQFGKVGRNIDFESEKPKLATESFVERPKVEQNEGPSTSRQTRDEMKKIEDKEKEETDRSDFKSFDNPPTVRKAPAATSDNLIVQHEPTGAFLKMWTSVDHVVIPPVIKPKKSSFIPNFIMGSVLLRSLEECLDGNEEMKWICPFYFSLPVRVYYAVLFYLQILKAKESAGKIGKAESTWYRAFKRSFPLESLPVVGPMVPYYTNIVSVKPNDDKYDYIYPDYQTDAGLNVENGQPIVDMKYYFLQPSVLMLAGFLRQFCTLTGNELVGVTNGADDYFDNHGSLVPHRLRTQFRFVGIDYPAQLTVNHSSTLSNPALDYFLPETKARCIDIHPYWRRSKAMDIPAENENCGYSTIGEALRMIDDFEWFEACVYMATIQCKFFAHSTNMSQIPSVGGSEALVTAHITGNKEKYKGRTDWFPRHWRNLKSRFQTTRADTKPDEFLNAEFALSNATLSWQVNDHPIGGRQNGQRLGPYWDNREFEFATETDIEVARRITTVIQSQFYDREGNAS
jgi:hypothetical protein